MDDLKKPTSLLAGTNIILTLGGLSYLYKKIEQLQNENAEMKQDLVKLTEKLQKNNNEDLQTEELLQTIRKEVKTLKKDNRYEDDIHALASALEDNDINVKLPSQSKKEKLKKHKNYKFASSSSEESTEESEEVIKPKKTKGNKKNKEDLEGKDLINLLKSKK
jgi:hypothetical protein